MMQGISNWLGSILFLFAVVVGFPLAALFLPRRKNATGPSAEGSDAHPFVYCVLGALVTALAAIAGGIVAWGFLFPGLGWIAANRLSAFSIWIPIGTRSRGQSARLLVSDTEMSFLISAIAAGIAAVGIFLIARGIRRLMCSAP